MAKTVFALRAGARVGGRYEIIGGLGRGAMGEVYAAVHGPLKLPVAVKILRASSARRPELMARFRTEARAAAKVNHPGIIAVHDFGFTDDGSPFLVMERLDGETLAAWLGRVGPLPPRAAVQVICEILEPLAAAHHAGVVHRDLKPENVFLVERPTQGVKIVDFGVSKLRGDEDPVVTMTGELIGTPLYMAPEQARGERDVGPPADLWACGVMLYTIVAGRPPFTAPTAQGVLGQVLTSRPKPIDQVKGGLPPLLVRAIDRLLAYDPARRPPSAEAAREELLAAVALDRPAGAIGISKLLTMPADAIGSMYETPPTLAPTPPEMAGPLFVGAPTIRTTAAEVAAAFGPAVDATGAAGEPYLEPSVAAPPPDYELPTPTGVSGDFDALDPPPPMKATPGAIDDDAPTIQARQMQTPFVLPSQPAMPAVAPSQPTLSMASPPSGVEVAPAPPSRPIVRPPARATATEPVVKLDSLLEAPPPKPWALMIIAAAVVVALAALALALVLHRHAVPHPQPPHPEVAPVVPEEKPTVTPIVPIEVTLTATPANARWTLDGETLDGNPAKVSRPSGSRAHAVATAPGRTPVAVEVRFDEPHDEPVKLPPLPPAARKLPKPPGHLQVDPSDPYAQ